MNNHFFIALLAIFGIQSMALADRIWPTQDYWAVINRVFASYPKLVHDPQENESKLKEAFSYADAKAICGLQNAPPEYPSFILLFWKVKKSILFREYGIHWKSPADLNPKIDFTHINTEQGAAANP
jgi:hypothetical protein